jgi:hypothetical protein
MMIPKTLRRLAEYVFQSVSVAKYLSVISFVPEETKRAATELNRDGY